MNTTLITIHSKKLVVHYQKPTLTTSVTAVCRSILFRQLGGCVHSPIHHLRTAESQHRWSMIDAVAATTSFWPEWYTHTASHPYQLIFTHLHSHYQLILQHYNNSSQYEIDKISVTLHSQLVVSLSTGPMYKDQYHCPFIIHTQQQYDTFVATQQNSWQETDNSPFSFTLCSVS